MSWKEIAASWRHALRGLVNTWKTQRNFRWQTLAGAVVICLLFLFPLRLWERVMLLLLVALTLIMELLNTAVEYCVDLFKPRIHPYVQLVKDSMAGAVLLSALASLVIGVMILWPYCMAWLK